MSLIVSQTKYGQIKAVDQCNKKSIKSWSENNDIERYSIHHEGKFVVAERNIRTLKKKIYQYLTLISKKVYIDKLTTIHVNDNLC